MSGTALPVRARPDRPELVFRAAILVLATGTMGVILVPAIHGHVVAPALDLALDTAAAIIAGSLTLLSWVRFRERREVIALYQAAAFLGLAVAYSIAVTISVTEGTTMGLGVPVSASTYVFAAARVVAALCLVIGGTAMARRASPPYPGIVLLLPTLVVAAVAVLTLPGSGSPSDLLLVMPGATIDGLPDLTKLGAFVQVVTATLFFEAAFVCRTLWRRDRVVMDAWVAIALVFAGFGEIHWMLYPSGHPGHISTADILRLAFFVSLLVGIEAEARVTLRSLRTANVELVELRDAAAESAALEERARLARELHDGLAQDLWLAKLKTAQVAAVAGMPADARTLLTDAENAIESGLTEARQAVLALRLAADQDQDFGSLMRRYIQEFEERFGMRAEFTFEGDGATLGTRTQAEVMRIAQEALTNVRQHANATVVGVRLTIAHGRVSVRVVDNGCGFDAKAPATDRYGLVSMRERAALIGGRLQVKSAPGLGTVVILSAPLDHGRPAVQVSGTTA